MARIDKFEDLEIWQKVGILDGNSVLEGLFDFKSKFYYC
jgi:hypothetical protein